MSQVTPLKFEGSDALIAYRLTNSRFLRQEIPKDATVDSVVCLVAADALDNGKQIGSLNVLHQVSIEISNLQKINQHIESIAPQAATKLKDKDGKEQDGKEQVVGFHANLKALVDEHNTMQLNTDAAKNEILEKTQKAPNPKAFLNEFPQLKKAIKQPTQEFSEKVEKLRKLVLDQQIKNQDVYVSLYLNIHGKNPPAIEIEKEKTITRPRANAVSTPAKASERQKSGPSS